MKLEPFSPPFRPPGQAAGSHLGGDLPAAFGRAMRLEMRGGMSSIHRARTRAEPEKAKASSESSDHLAAHHSSCWFRIFKLESWDR